MEILASRVLLRPADYQKTLTFYRDALGFKESDRIVTEYFGYQVDLDFLHTGPRHHSVAFGGPQQKRIHHFMLEVGAIDDVGLLDDPVTHQAAREAVSAALVATGKQVCQVERQGPTRGRSVGTVSLRRPAVKICHACNNTHVCI